VVVGALPPLPLLMVSNKHNAATIVEEIEQPSGEKSFILYCVLLALPLLTTAAAAAVGGWKGIVWTVDWVITTQTAFV